MRRHSRKKKPQEQPCYRTVRKRLMSLKPSPENLKLYKAIDDDDPEIIKLAQSIKKEGLHEPLIITEDNYVVLGHRRLIALNLIEQQIVPCRVLAIKQCSMRTDEYIAILLALRHRLLEHQRQSERPGSNRHEHPAAVEHASTGKCVEEPMSGQQNQLRAVVDDLAIGPAERVEGIETRLAAIEKRTGRLELAWAMVSGGGIVVVGVIGYAMWVVERLWK